MRLPIAILVSVLALSSAASAAPLTARASGVLSVYAAPSGPFRTLVDKLKKNERVIVVSCTRRARWCEIEQLDGGPSGWVDGEYLIGSPAKNAVTPYEFSFDPLDPLDLFKHRH